MSAFGKVEGQTSFMRYATNGERRIARKLVAAILERGGTISVQDGVEWTVKGSTRTTVILGALCTTGEDLVRWRDAQGELVATFTLIWGNAEDGEELVADYTDNDAANEVYNFVAGHDQDEEA